MITPTTVTLAIQLLVPLFALHVWWTLRRPDTLGPRLADRLGLVLLAWCVGAAALSLHPGLVAVRETVVWVQPAVIGTVVLAALLLHGSQTVRDGFRRAAMPPLIGLFVWRIVFGMLLAALWLSGGLPAAFAWSAALGDIAVGLWALGLLALERAGRRPKALHLHVWNAAGLLDLVNVMRLAITVLVPWLVERPQLPRFAMLPLFGVPLLIALHLHIWRAFRGSLQATRV